jgi:hypothetical protein
MYRPHPLGDAAVYGSATGTPRRNFPIRVWSTRFAACVERQSNRHRTPERILGTSTTREATMGDVRIQLLGTLELFDGCSTRLRRAVAGLGTPLSVGAGSVLCREGDDAREFYVVLDGTVALTRDGGAVSTLGRGSWWGDAGTARRRGTHAVTAVAVGPVALMVYERREFLALVERCPVIAERLARRRAVDATDVDVAPSGGARVRATVRAQAARL